MSIAPDRSSQGTVGRQPFIRLAGKNPSRARDLSGSKGSTRFRIRRLDLTLSRFELEGEGDYVPENGDYTIGLPTTSVRGTPPGKTATNRTESAVRAAYSKCSASGSR